jgi:hypothetical protein
MCGLDSTGSGQGPVAGCCECGDELSGSCATELVSELVKYLNSLLKACILRQYHSNRITLATTKLLNRNYSVFIN